jgi:hypothetical protein
MRPCLSARAGAHTGLRREEIRVIKFLLWCVLLILCWPVALIAALLYPFVWLILLPFRLVGIAVHGVLELVAAIIFLPARLLRAI